jgi:hypothetical protein
MTTARILRRVPMYVAGREHPLRDPVGMGDTLGTMDG